MLNVSTIELTINKNDRQAQSLAKLWQKKI